MSDVPHYNPLTRWVHVAIAAGHYPVHEVGSAMTLQTRAQGKSTNHTAWGVGFIVLFLSGFVTLFLSWILLFPYLIAWGIVGARGSRKRRQVQQYVLTVDTEGWLVTNPPEIAADLIDAAIEQGVISEDDLQ